MKPTNNIAGFLVKFIFIAVSIGSVFVLTAGKILLPSDFNWYTILSSILVLAIAYALISDIEETIE